MDKIITDVEKLLHEEITQHGAISFARYMEIVLYAPGLGYYSAYSHKIGAEGDFITAPELSPLFSQCLARQCQQVLSSIKGKKYILEVGPGSGAMALELLRTLANNDSLPDCYYLLEVSADFKARQQKLLRTELPHLYDRFKWLEKLPTEKFNGIILANEVLDAMPVKRFKISAGKLCEYYVIYNEGKLAWHMAAPSKELCSAYESLNLQLADGYESEINLNVAPWLASMGDILAKGLLLIIDYGYPRHEYYHPDRTMGTLLCHFRHRSHDDVFFLPGLQDITAHIDFTKVAEAALANQFQVDGYTDQASFLINCGILPLLQAKGIDFKLQQQAKMLLMPSEMGELFKVMALTKNFSMPLLGFANHDKRQRL